MNYIFDFAIISTTFLRRAEFYFMGIGRGRFCRNGLLFFLMVFALLSARSRAEGSDRPYYTDIGQFNYAKFLMREGDYKTASKEFARFIEGFPESPLMP